MSRLMAVISLVLLGVGRAWASDNASGGVKLLEGYHINTKPSVDSRAWTIEGEGRPTIHFEAGPSEGMWADPKNKRQYSWYKEQTVYGRRVQLALIKPGVKTVWEPVKSQGSKAGNILLVTFLLDNRNTNYTANFAAKLVNPEDLVDVLLMVLTFDPAKAGL